MCGICGIVTTQPLADLQSVRRMNAALIHRGPDGAGEYTSAHLAMALRRLSIIDLNTGWQPLYNENRSLSLIANGEIYNYIELRAALEAKGHRFATHSDCETILHLYEEYGLDCVHHLRGMFAFALWDEQRRRLFLARDRIGEKPLYIHQQDGLLIFSSEIKSILRSGSIPFEFDPDAVNLYFHYQYLPEPRTPIRGVHKLPAGSYLVVDVEPWQVTEKTYWKIEDIPPLEGDPVTTIRRELEAVSELVIRSDVPVGVALSGGVDSSAIAALIARKYPGLLQAFSVGYPGYPENDERRIAKSLATQLKIDFHEVEISTDEMVDFFPQLVAASDDPIADISGFGYYAVSRKAHELGVPVLLQGHGGDELFWYEDVRQAAQQTLRKQALLNKKASIFNYLFFLPPHISHPKALAGWVLRGRWLGLDEYRRDMATHPDQMVFMETVPDFLLAQKSARGYYQPTFDACLDHALPEKLYRFPHPWPDVPVTLTKLIIETYLLENGIAQGDRLSMSNSVELRLPLVDYRLVETVIGLRRRYPDHHLPAKHWFKKSVADLLPPEILSQPKRGFAPPLEWHNRIFQRYGALLVDGMLVQAGILTPEAGRELASGYFPPTGISPISFKALVLELWSRHLTGSLQTN